MRLGQARDPWAFLPLGLRALEVAPGDAAIRLLVGVNFTKVGLRTAAREQFAALPAEVLAERQIQALAAEADALTEDRIQADELVAVCRGNMAALGVRGVGANAGLEAWAAGLAHWEWFRAGDGNVVRRRAGTSAWTGVVDQRGAAKKFVGTRLTDAAIAGVDSLVVEGIDPPWLLLAVAGRAAVQKDGFQARLVVVQSDPGEFLDGLAQADLSGVLGQERVRVFVGVDASARLLEDLRSRDATKLGGAHIPLLSLRTKLTPGVTDVIGRAEREQAAEYERLQARVDALYAGRDRAWWARRYAEAGSGGAPLRVLVPTCRYSTFIKHSSADLVGAFRDAGCRAELLIEPDDHAHFSSLAYLRAMLELEPDLVVLINYPRSTLGGFVPRNLPWVCWIQDAMPHQFDEKAAAAQGEFDFIVGHAHRELFERFGYPRARVRHMPVVASTAKFHAGPVDAALRRAHGCDIAMVTHHSETPAAMHERLRREASSEPRVLPVLDRVRGRVEQIASDPWAVFAHKELERAVREELAAGMGGEPDPRTVTLLLRQYAMPLADRVLRHRTLEWAARLADKRGWRLNLYGRGWDTHPTLARFARGELAHGEELRASYRCAGAHLHASIHTLVHQRVMECALSGGLPVCRLHRDGFAEVTGHAKRAAVLRGEPDADLGQGVAGFAVANHAELMASTSQAQRLGIACEALVRVERRQVSDFRAADHPATSGVNAGWLLGDLRETTFRTEQELEEVLERAITRAEWRENLSRGIAARTRERLSHGALVGQIVGLVSGSFGAERIADGVEVKGKMGVAA